MYHPKPSSIAIYAQSVALGLLLLLPRARAVECYGLDGTRADSTSQPCNPEAEVSACCATNKDRPDICLSSGLCYSQEAGHEGLIYSNGCTDKTGMADECPHFCPDRRDDWDGGKEVDTYNILQCNAGRQFCCRAADDKNNCCDDAKTFDIGKLVFPARAGTTGVDGKSAPAGTSAECPKNNTTIVGGAIGGVLGAALLASLGFITMLLLKRPKAQREVSETGSAKVVQWGTENVAFPPQELSATGNVYEAPGITCTSSREQRGKL